MKDVIIKIPQSDISEEETACRLVRVYQLILSWPKPDSEETKFINPTSGSPGEA